MKLTNIIFVIISLMIYYILTSLVLNNPDIFSYERGTKVLIVIVLLIISLPMLIMKERSASFIKWQLIIKTSIFIILYFIKGYIDYKLCLGIILILDFAYNFFVIGLSESEDDGAML